MDSAGVPVKGAGVTRKETRRKVWGFRAPLRMQRHGLRVTVSRSIRVSGPGPGSCRATASGVPQLAGEPLQWPGHALQVGKPQSEPPGLGFGLGHPTWSLGLRDLQVVRRNPAIIRLVSG